MKRMTPAFLVAVLALVVAMSGTSVAVTQLARGSVDTKHLKRHSVTLTKIDPAARKRLLAGKASKGTTFVTQSSTLTAAPGAEARADRVCEKGQAIGGGYVLASAGAENLRVFSDGLVTVHAGQYVYRLGFLNEGAPESGDITLSVTLTCAVPAP